MIDWSMVVIRDVITHSEYREVEELQKEVWVCEERDIVPLSQLISAKETGGVLLGAFNGSTLMGFVYGFVGYEEDEVVVHSHLLAVRPEFVGHNLGYRLKLAQRDQTLSKGIRIITWTFDPLQSLNAHLNIEKLGVIGVGYRIDFYGETSSPLHRDIGTDRLWAKWELDSERVRQRLECVRKSCSDPRGNTRLVRAGGDGRPVRVDSLFRSSQNLVIEVPGNIGSFQQDQPELGAEWRQVTREAFLSAFSSGYVVTGYCRGEAPSGTLGAYILTAPSSLSHKNRS
jgi:predicted GNAT superfamily acetyltransferase